MSRIQVGQTVLLVPDNVARTVEAKDNEGVAREATEVPSVVAGPLNTLLELAYRRWDGKDRSRP